MTKSIALVAHDNRKNDLMNWVRYNLSHLLTLKMVCTGTTGKLIRKIIETETSQLFQLQCLKSGPLGGDQQMGAMIAEGKIDLMIFFWDPMEPQPHDVDVKALLRIAVVYNIPTACNLATADFLVQSPLFQADYQPVQQDYQAHLARNPLKE